MTKKVSIRRRRLLAGGLLALVVLAGSPGSVPEPGARPEAGPGGRADSGAGVLPGRPAAGTPPVTGRDLPATPPGPGRALAHPERLPQGEALPAAKRVGERVGSRTANAKFFG